MATVATFNFENNTPLNNNSSLHSSVAQGQLKTVQRLISLGCDPNAPHATTGLRPIHFAASRGHADLVQFLVETSQVQIDATDKEGETALLKAAYFGHLSVVQYLVQSNANHLHQDRDGWTALHNACSCGNLDLVKYLIELPNMSVNVISQQGHTPLMNAASKGYLDIVLALLNREQGANPMIVNKFGETAYDVAAAAGEANLCQVLEQYERKWHNPLLPFNPLELHVTIPVHLIEEQQITITSKSYLRSKSPMATSNSVWYFKGDIIENKSKVDLPNSQWFWLSDWTIDYTIPRVKNNEGWSYSQMSDNMESDHHWSSYLPTTTNQNQQQQWFRTRQWTRIMKKVVDTQRLYHDRNDTDSIQSTHSSSNSSSGSSIDNRSDEENELTNIQKKTMTSVGTTMTKAQSTFIGCSSHILQPLLKEQLPLDLNRTESSNRLLFWEANDQSTACRRCQQSFSFIVRKHHCRKCGQLVCDKCSTQRVYLPPTDIIQPFDIPMHDLHLLSMRPQRICDQCVSSVHNNDYLIRKQKKRSSVMLECPVCAKNLTGYLTVQAGEDHVKSCLEGNHASSTSGVRFVVYRLNENSTMIGQECVICFEEFGANDTITRLNCMCSYHGHCINTWFSKGKECPIHSR